MSDGAGAGLFEVAGGFGRTGVGGAGDAALSRLQPAINKMALENVAQRIAFMVVCTRGPIRFERPAIRRTVVKKKRRRSAAILTLLRID